MREKYCYYWEYSKIFYKPDCLIGKSIPKRYLVYHNIDRCPYCYKPIYIMDFL